MEGPSVPVTPDCLSIQRLTTHAHSAAAGLNDPLHAMIPGSVEWGSIVRITAPIRLALSALSAISHRTIVLAISCTNSSVVRAMTVGR